MWAVNIPHRMRVIVTDGPFPFESKVKRVAVSE